MRRMQRESHGLLEEVEVGSLRRIYVLEDSSNLAEVLLIEKATKRESSARQSRGNKSKSRPLLPQGKW